MKAAILEIDGSHDECLHSQVLFLKQGGYRVTLICSSDLKVQVREIPADEKIYIDIRNRKGLSRWSSLLALRSILVKGEFDKIIFNSAHGSTIRDFCLLPFSGKARFFGTMHGINKLKGSIGQQLIGRRIKNYFVLNDYLLDNLKSFPLNGKKFTSYYPIFFPDFEDKPLVTKPTNELWVCIPGQVEYKRRDYESLVKAIAESKNTGHLRFLCLGRSDHAHGNGPELKALVKAHGLTKQFVFWDGFVDNPTFHAWLAASDVVMPLIHPGNDGFEKYLHFQISGAYNLAFAYKKPLLMLQEFEWYEDFKYNAVFYKIDTLAWVLGQLPELLKEKQHRCYQNSKYTFDNQAEAYLRYIGTSLE